MDEKQILAADERFMRRALHLARRGAGRVSPNPLVGAVIVKDGEIIGEGWHRRCGENHAEINAIQNATGAIEGSTFYVTLEPCSHHGRTPPCADALVTRRPGRVVIGSTDPNPLVSGRGIEILRNNGIETTVGVLAGECAEINRFFFKYIRTGLPYVTLKFAQSLDGRIASVSGDSRWISSPDSLHFAHSLRAIHDAVLVGAGTAKTDNPKLTCRLARGRDPLRIVIDSGLRLPPDLALFSDSGGTLVACAAFAPAEKRALLEQKGVETIEISHNEHGHVSLRELLKNLGRRQLSSLLVEGGAGIATAFLKERLVDNLLVILAPKIIGRGIEAIGDLGVGKIEEALGFSFRKISRRGNDLIIDIRLANREADAPG